MPASFTSVSDARLTTDKPADEELFTDLADDDVYQKSDATNGGAGIAPTVDAFASAFVAHSHDGTDGEGQAIPTAGIADSGVNASDMFPAGVVDTTKLSTSGASRMQAVNFADNAVELEKLDPDIGAPFSGSQAEATGLTASFSHGLTHRPVIGNDGTGEIEIVGTSSTTITVGRRPGSVADPWSWSIRGF